MIPGFVRLSVTGEQRERFLNLCKSRGIMFRRIVQTGEKELLLTMRVKDFFLIGPLRRKTGVHIHILKKRGPVFFLLACRRNKLLPAGVLMVIGVLFFSVRKGLEHSYRGEYFKSYATAGRLSGRERHLLWSIQKEDPLQCTGRRDAAGVSGNYLGIGKTFRDQAEF